MIHPLPRPLLLLLVLISHAGILVGQSDSLKAALLRADQLRQQGDWKAAESRYLALIPQAKADTAWEILANAYLRLGGIYADRGQTEWNYQTFIKPGRELAKEKYPESAFLALGFALLEAQYFWNTGRYRYALEVLEQAEQRLPADLQAQTAAGLVGRHHLVVFTLRNLQVLCWQSLKDFERARTAAQQQLDAIEQLRLSGAPKMTTTLLSGIYHLNQGVTYDAHDQWDEALAAYVLAAELFAETERAYLPNALFNQAGIWYRKKNYTRAQELAYAALRSSDPPTAPELTKVYDLLAKIAYDTGQPDSLYLHSRHVLALRSPVPEKMRQTQEVPATQELEAESYVFNALRMLSAYHLQQARQGMDSTANLQAALAYAQLTRSWVDSLRREGYFGGPNDYFSAGDTLAAHMEAGIEAALALSKAAPGNLSGPQTALQLSEANKYSRLVYGLRREARERIDGIPQDSLQKEELLFNQIAFFSSQSGAVPDSSRQAIQDSLDRYQADLQSLLTYFRATHPRYYQLRYDPAEPILSAVQAHLQPRQAILEFFYGREQLYRFLITRDTLIADQLPIGTALAETIATFQQGCSRYQPDSLPELAQAGHVLYQQLLASPVAFLQAHRPGTWHLGLIADGPLQGLSWAAMLTAPAPRPDDPATWPFLVRNPELIISYQHALSLMMAKRFDKPRRYKRTYAGFAGWYASGDLPEARRSVQELAQVSSGWGQSAQAWVGSPDEALSSALFWAQADLAQVLHLSLHGRANFRDPMASSLYFSADDSLLAFQLYDRNLSAELVILDACEMGIGQVQLGEGMLSMASGFAYAGAPATLTSLWQLDEKSSRFLMARFFAALHAGQPKDAAWQQAQLAYLEESSGNKHPFFWAALIPVGDMEPLSQRNFTWAYGLVGLVVLVLGGWWWWRRRKA